MPKETSAYKGNVKVAIKKGNKIVKKSNHNAGLPDMAYLFSKAITGTLDYNTDIPRLLDIGYVVPSTESAVNPGDSGVWMSVLTNPVPINGRQYKYDSALKNWVGIMTTTIYASDINGAMLSDVRQNLEIGNYKLYIRLCSYAQSGRHYFAQVEVDNTFLDEVIDSTSAIITWYSELLYNYGVEEALTDDIQGGN